MTEIVFCEIRAVFALTGVLRTPIRVICHNSTLLTIRDCVATGIVTNEFQ